MKRYLPAIGMRNLKTALAVFLSLLFYQLFPNRSPMYAVLASIMCVQPTVDSSLSAGVNRILGTALGGGLGYLIIRISWQYFGGRSPNILISLGIVAAIYLCILLRLPDAASMCCVVMVLIALEGYQQTDALVYTFNRVLDTSVGIVFAVLVNKYVKIKLPHLFPEKNDGDCPKE